MDDLTPQERNDRIRAAADAYLAGTITLEEYKQAERDYLPDYRAIALALTERRIAAGDEDD